MRKLHRLWPLTLLVIAGCGAGGSAQPVPTAPSAGLPTAAVATVPPAPTAAPATVPPAPTAAVSAPVLVPADPAPTAGPDATPSAGIDPALQVPTADPAALANVPPAMVAAAQDLLAAQLGRPAGELVAIAGMALDWPDPSLGCPQPGMMYPQVLVPGYQISYRAAGVDYAVHIGGGSALLCERGKATLLGELVGGGET